MNVPTNILETLKRLVSSADIGEEVKKRWLEELSSDNPSPETLIEIAETLDSIRDSNEILKKELTEVDSFFDKQEELLDSRGDKLSNDIKDFKTETSNLAKEVKELKQEFGATGEPHDQAGHNEASQLSVADGKPVEVRMPQQNNNQPPVSMPPEPQSDNNAKSQALDQSNSNDNTDTSKQTPQSPGDGYY